MMSFKQWFRRPVVLALVASSTAVAGACGISRQQEVEMGQQYSAEINRQLPMVNDAAVSRYINNLGRSIAQRGNRQYNYNFYVVNAAQINAFAVPGGHIYVNRGLVERTRNMSELAGVLAHEIAHVEHRHGISQMERMQAANLGLNIGYVLLGRAPTGVEEAVIGVGGTAYFASHSRGAENEADATAVTLLANSGINPNGLTSFFAVLISDQQRSPSTVQQWFSTHPLTQDRIENTQSYINRLPANQRGGRSDDSGYASMKNRLRSYRPAAS
ncbi:MAG: M48 family metalloprotease [Gemmatimonadetes bacterium]|nr:M48 family metalloprotease [Gemmatimonadota bacterium]